MAVRYDQFMRVAEIQYQNADIKVMTKVQHQDAPTHSLHRLLRRILAHLADGMQSSFASLAAEQRGLAANTRM